MIPDELIEQVRDAADLVEIIGEAVPLKRTGADWRGACPFHGGTHRNFAVIPKKGLFYCYVCHAAGDVFTYLMKRHGLDYPSAVREVARRVGITIPERSGREGPDPREPLFAAAAVAQEWFAARLREDPEAETARKYLAEREVPAEVIGEQGLGYAPRGPAFAEEMHRLGIEQAILLEAGLLFTRSDGTTGPRFRGRLLFPIRDLRGRPVGFGGRILGPGEPKYLNSPETPIFHKGALLYHLSEARHAIRREGVALVVEGYFDVLRLVMAGIDHVVAPLGTALTPDQAALLHRFAPAVILLYDSDTAGLRATFRAGDECLRHRMRVRAATMPEGEDPDSLVRKGGAAALAPILKDALDILDRKIQLLERRGWFEGLEHRRDALDRLLPTVRAAADPIARDLYLARLAERTGVSRAVLEQELAARPEPPRPPAAPSPEHRPGTPPARPPRAEVLGAAQEAALLATLLADHGWRARGRRELSPGDFHLPAHREVFEALLALPHDAPAGAAAEGLSPRGQAKLQHLLERQAGDAERGLDLDAQYVAALDALRAREVARSLAPVSEIERRQSQKRQLSPQERAKLALRQAAARSRGSDHTKPS